MSFHINPNGLRDLADGKSILISDGVHPTYTEVKLDADARKMLKEWLSKEKKPWEGWGEPCEFCGASTDWWDNCCAKWQEKYKPKEGGYLVPAELNNPEGHAKFWEAHQAAARLKCYCGGSQTDPCPYCILPVEKHNPKPKGMSVEQAKKVITEFAALEDDESPTLRDSRTVESGGRGLGCSAAGANDQGRSPKQDSTEPHVAGQCWCGEWHGTEPIIYSTEHDPVSRPAHYNQGTIEPIDAIEDWGCGFLDGNAVKYLARWRHKGGVEDLKKARWYVDRLIKSAVA